MAQLRSIQVTREGNFAELAPNTIVRIEVLGAGHCLLKTTHGTTYRIAKPIARLHNSLPHFWRIHPAHLVNPDFVNGTFGSVKHDGILLLTAEEPVPVSKEQKEKVYALLLLKFAQMPTQERGRKILLNFFLRCQY